VQFGQHRVKIIGSQARRPKKILKGLRSMSSLSRNAQIEIVEPAAPDSAVLSFFMKGGDSSIYSHLVADLAGTRIKCEKKARWL
jgi:hypothetical protein